MRNSCAHEQPVSNTLHFPCQLVQQYSHAVSLVKLSCHAMYKICHKAPKFYPRYFLLFRIYNAEKYIIHGQMLCRVLRCGLNFLEAF
jgi:hypothetical protein